MGAYHYGHMEQSQYRSNRTAHINLHVRHPGVRSPAPNDHVGQHHDAPLPPTVEVLGNKLLVLYQPGRMSPKPERPMSTAR